jgi:large subunit ribosomal protein L13
MRTQHANKRDVERKWIVVDAKDKVLGRLATRVAACLRGKNKPIFTPNVDTGDFVIIINAEKIRLTGRKLNDKTYYWHTGYIGGIKEEKAKDRLKRRPEMLIQKAVWGMLPKNRLGRAIFRKLKVYSGEEHPHSSQKPEHVEV